MDVIPFEAIHSRYARVPFTPLTEEEKTVFLTGFFFKFWLFSSLSLIHKYARIHSKKLSIFRNYHLNPFHSVYLIYGLNCTRWFATSSFEARFEIFAMCRFILMI